MEFLTESWQGNVMTVRGLLDADELGITLPHEHLLVRHQGPLVDMVDAQVASDELLRFAAYGGKTIVDMTNIGLGRDPLAVQQVSAQSGVNVVLGTGFYKDAWLPGYVHQMTIGQMAETMVVDIVQGIDGLPIQAGVIGEIGVSRPTTHTEEKALAAAARAQRATGAAINVHFDIGGKSAEYNHAIDILEAEGADLTRVVLDHFICRPDELELVQQLTSRGCYVEFDLFGQEMWVKIYELTGNTQPEVQVASLYWFIAAGLVERILISQDVGNRVCLRKHGGYGYAHILKNLTPMFHEYGITVDHLQTLMVGNPKRLFPFQKLPS